MNPHSEYLMNPHSERVPSAGATRAPPPRLDDREELDRRAPLTNRYEAWRGATALPPGLLVTHAEYPRRFLAEYPR